jgi:hypothetical protein
MSDATAKGYVIWFEIACIFCGHRSPDDRLLVGETISGFNKRKRCKRCGGPYGYTGETQREIKPLAIEELLAIAPRRGRPPKWLVRARQQGIA